jgi:hypothetical protein
VKIHENWREAMNLAHCVDVISWASPLSPSLDIGAPKSEPKTVNQQFGAVSGLLAPGNEKK